MLKTCVAATVLAGVAIPLRAQATLPSTRVVQTMVSDVGTPIVYPRTDSAEVTALLVEVPPGGVGSPHRHEVPVFIYVLEGTLDVDTEGHGTSSHKVGEGFVEAQNLTHVVINRGSVQARALIVIAGERGKPVSRQPS